MPMSPSNRENMPRSARLQVTAKTCRGRLGSGSQRAQAIYCGWLLNGQQYNPLVNGRPDPWAQ
jgi:hypothetical protein